MLSLLTSYANLGQVRVDASDFSFVRWHHVLTLDLVSCWVNLSSLRLVPLSTAIPIRTYFCCSPILDSATETRNVDVTLQRLP